MMNKVKTNKANARRISIFAVAIILLVAAAVALIAYARPSVKAEGGGSVTIHVYDPEQEYSQLAGWVWLKGGSGTEFGMSAQPKPGEQFSKTYTDNNVEVTNTAHVIEATFTESEIAQFKGGRQIGFLVCASTGNTSGDFWSRYTKEGLPDVFVDISDKFDENNHADIYFIRKDTKGHTDVEGAKMALEKVTGARFTGKDASGATVEFEATNPITSETKVTLYNGGSVLERSVTAAPGETSFKGTARFTSIGGSNFDFTADYIIKIDGINTGASILKSAFIDDADFIAQFESAETQNTKLGVSIEDGKTAFKLWAPFASSVSLNLYEKGEGGDPLKTVAMTKYVKNATDKWGGIWLYETTDNIRGRYYTYSVENPGFPVETTDPYAIACGANGDRAMVLDLATTNPDGWENDKHLYETNPLNADTPVIWELHVKDFSMSPDSGMKYKGKYLAFTETGTTVPGTNYKTGVDYLKELGITYVHLNPVYDFRTVDESDLSGADDTKDKFNWGYDPQNYNIPEGSYSTDPSRGDVRIREFKQMVMALHNAGIGVIMDVVYNHTYSTTGQSLHDTVPYYYHRTLANGSFSDKTGCGNGTASERSMTRKYFVESLLHWATEYHIDGFRFDLMGVHDNVTMTTIREALDALDGGNGRKILIYGEPWVGGEWGVDPYSYTKRLASTSTANPGGGKYTSNAGNNLVENIYNSGNVSALHERVAIFNDDGRNGLRGNNGDDYWQQGPSSGWASGNSYETSKVQKMLQGGVDDNQPTNAKFDGKYTGAGSRNVAYASAHDNYPLWDQFFGKMGGTETPLFYENAIDYYVNLCELASSTYLMSSGMTFMLAGEEMGRTKYGNHNSYNSPHKGNMLTWSRQIEFESLVNHYKRVIAVRKAYSALFFSYAKSTDKTFCYGDFTGTGDGAIVFTRTSGSNKLVCVFNATDYTKSVSGLGALKLYVRNGVVSNNGSASSVSVAPHSVAILGTLDV